MRRWLGAVLLLAGCGAVAEDRDVLPEGVEARALDGRPLTAPTLAAATRQARERDLALAQAAVDAAPDDADALIWLGRRLGYLGRFRDAIATFGNGVARFPADARFLRHRGHRYITVRRFDLAIADLERAAELMLATPDAVEPDGQPNARNVPTSTLYFNVYYHLALAHYLAGNFPRSAEVWASCRGVSHNPDKLVSCGFWQYLTLRRLRDEAGAAAVLAAVRDGLDVIENHSYYALLRAFAAGDATLAATGSGDNDRATVGNGMATWLWLSGDAERAKVKWAEVLATTSWPAFGYIAAEVELLRAQ